MTIDLGFVVSDDGLKFREPSHEWTFLEARRRMGPGIKAEFCKAKDSKTSAIRLLSTTARGIRGTGRIRQNGAAWASPRCRRIALANSWWRRQVRAAATINCRSSKANSSRQPYRPSPTPRSDCFSTPTAWVLTRISKSSCSTTASTPWPVFRARMEPSCARVVSIRQSFGTGSTLSRAYRADSHPRDVRRQAEN